MNSINQKDYLKKYLKIGKQSGEKKKKKKSEKPSGKGLKIIDDDVDTALSQEIQDDLDAANEDAPQVVAIIDERPPSMRVDEKTKNSLWQPIGGATNTSAEFQSFKLGTTIKLQKNRDHAMNRVTDKSLANKERVKNVSQSKTTDSKKIYDISPERYKKQDYAPRKSSEEGHSPRRPKHTRDIDYSPPRNLVNAPPKRDKTENDYSPPRKRVAKSSSRDDGYPHSRKGDDSSPPKKNTKYPPAEKNNPPQRKRDKDYSPPRRTDKESSLKEDYSHLRKRDDNSPRKRNEDYSPPRKRDKDYSPPRKRDKDYSPPRKRDKDHSPTRRKDKDSSPHRKKEKDYSPPRKKDKDYSPPRRTNRDLSPPRTIDKSTSSELRKRGNHSPSRKKLEPSKKGKDSSPVRKKRSRWEKDDSPSRSPSKPETTMSGKKAGLQSAQNLVEDIARLQKQEEEMFKTMSSDVSGANAATVVRRKKQEEVVDPQKEAREKELKQKYSVWGKGLKQVQDESEKFADQQREMNKPLARYAGDEDLEKYLKEQEREGDPMLAYIRKKKKKVAVEQGVPEKPTYMGDFMPNRFGIRPGYRWDGVDRSNGYEKKWFEVQNSKKAMQDEALKWSTEDM